MMGFGLLANFKPEIKTSLTGFIEWIPSLKLTFSHLKMDGWNTTFLLGWPIFRGFCCYVSFRKGTLPRSSTNSSRQNQSWDRKCNDPNPISGIQRALFSGALTDWLWKSQFKWWVVGCGPLTGCQSLGQDDITFSVGNPNRNLHFPLESWEGAISRVSSEYPPSTIWLSMLHVSPCGPCVDARWIVDGIL